MPKKNFHTDDVVSNSSVLENTLKKAHKEFKTSRQVHIRPFALKRILENILYFLSHIPYQINTGFNKLVCFPVTRGL